MVEDFKRDNFRWVATLLRGYAGQPDKLNKSLMFRALCSDNLDTILAALDIAASQEPANDQTV